MVLYLSQISLQATGVPPLSFWNRPKKQQLFGQGQLLLNLERFIELALAQVRSKCI